ncbi:putative sucrose utilization protein SUC1 [Talaromyces islandicus]|uniref:Putative sucrose utilization protein SUC1 n=1 Tax=Talaromyces islandicus TaxID=28573 RepID=A0A0U1LK46_TALIS|nr:putative sucrose utilization protein SUC1 [Talaromyces islandicus]
MTSAGEKKPTAGRWNNPCDSCSIRRVKCDRQSPCKACKSRSQLCTYFKVRKKPGPKGPRSMTSDKIRELQKMQQHEQEQKYEQASPPQSTPMYTAPPHPPPLAPTSGEPASLASSPRIPLAAYCVTLDLFKARLYSVWPIISTDELKARMASSDTDPDLSSHALAAAACAATLAQLKVPHAGFNESLRPVSGEEFAKECLMIRSKISSYPEPSLASLNTSIFLHMFYANTGHATAATLSLREAIAYADLTNLSTDTTLDKYDQTERELRSRIYWILFVTERTYCMQHGLPLTLQKTAFIPTTREGDGNIEKHAALYLLASLFVHIQTPLLQIHSTMLEMSPAAYSPTQILDVQHQIEPASVKPSRVSESQRVDILTTAAWLRSLLWQYSAAHFMLSSATKNEPLSLDYPFVIARDFLQSLSGISIESIRPHGYGMEIKLLQIANSMLDVIACMPDPQQRQLCYCGPLDAVAAIENLLLTVGGKQSPRFTVLQERLSQIHPQNNMPKQMSYVFPKQEPYSTPSSGSDSSTENDPTGHSPTVVAAATQMAISVPIQLPGQVNGIREWAMNGWIGREEEDFRTRHGSLCEHRIEDLDS